ncbi:AAA family ATPase [Variovorax sp. LT1P1]|uniref:AAA family ATPase n=1 Tax=Variovorax sp. LT1P1 TaxID=3443730 RepID=UPI003F48E9ED
MMEIIRGTLLAPGNEKIAPAISSTNLAAYCKIDKNKLTYRLTLKDLPAGRTSAKGGRREFSLAEARQWTRAYRTACMRPEGQKGVTLASSNFKGGSNKTTTAMVLAQGLSLRGHRVLVIDCDPQGSLTTLFGLLPAADVDNEQTILPLCLGDVKDLRSAVRPTYWDGLDLIAASPALFSAEFALPAMANKDPRAKFWEVLNSGLESVRDEYDVIIIDTPPSLSYVTMNALFAADGLIVPIPPSALDYASLAQFWNLFTDLGVGLEARSMTAKHFDFVHVLLTQVEPDSQDPTTTQVRRWIQSVYGEYLLPIEIPKTAATTSKAADFGTIYDAGRNDMNARTYKRAIEAYDRLVELVESSIIKTWANRSALAAGGVGGSATAVAA